MSEELFKVNYNKLPNIAVTKKMFSSEKEMIIYSRADVTYANLYIEGFIESLHTTNPNLISHFHIMGENNEVIQKFINEHGEILSHKNVSLSFEVIPGLDKALCISRRLCRAIQILNYSRCRFFKLIWIVFF